MTPARPNPAELHRLAAKYRTLGDLRRARARGEPVPPREIFKALADEFPGCLNELDTLPLDDIDAREKQLSHAAEGGPLEDWMAWLSSYHAWLRAALRIKSRLGRAVPLTDGRAHTLAVDAAARAALPVDASFVRAVERPPGGRINAVVFARIAALHGAPEETIKRALFPRSRRR